MSLPAGTIERVVRILRREFGEDWYGKVEFSLGQDGTAKVCTSTYAQISGYKQRRVVDGPRKAGVG